MRVPYAGNGPVFPPVLERLSVCWGRWPNRSVLRPEQPTGCVNTCVSRPSPSPPPWPCRSEMDCVRICLSWVPWGEKKKMHPLYDSLIGSFQSVDSSSVLTGQEGDVEIYEWPMYCWMMALHLGSLHAECEGMHGAFVGMNAGFPFTRRSLRVCAWPHPTVFKNLCLHSVANQKTGR